MIIAATTPIAAGIKIWRLFCRIVTWSVWLVRGPPYSGEEKVSVYDPTVEGAGNVSVTVRLSPGGMVTPVFVPTGCGLPWMKRFTVMTPVILVELFVRWSVAVTVWSFATVPIESVVDRRIVESVSAILDKLLTKPIPVASLASRNTTRFLAPRREWEVIVVEKFPFGSVTIRFEAARYRLGTSDDDTYA